MKRFRVEHEPTYGAIEVELDTDSIETMELVKNMVEFWTDWEHRLNLNDGDLLQTFLKQLCNKVMRVSAGGNLTTNGVIRQMFDEEGWTYLDGSTGIKLVDVESVDFDHEGDYEVKELEIVPGRGEV